MNKVKITTVCVALSLPMWLSTAAAWPSYGKGFPH